MKLVFSTYQSALVVAAGMKRGDTFDLALFDEAHQTAGRAGVHFGFALADKNLPIRQRPFLTATPRHYDVRHRDREGDARLVYSMDAPEIYGPVAHQLTFAEAARRGIICRYQVVVSVVTSETVNAHVLRHGEVIVQGDAVKARHVANQLALRAAVEKHCVGKIAQHSSNNCARVKPRLDYSIRKTPVSCPSTACPPNRDGLTHFGNE